MNLNEYLNKSEEELLNKIKNYNQIDTLLLKGTYEAIGNYGFFRNIRHESGKLLSYPIVKNRIAKVYSSLTNLVNGKRYSFPVKIAKDFEREKYANPFLLEASSNNLREIIELSEIEKKIRGKKNNLREIEINIAEKEILLKKIEREILEQEKEKQDLLEQTFAEIKEREKERKNESKRTIETYKSQEKEILQELEELYQEQKKHKQNFEQEKEEARQKLFRIRKQTDKYNTDKQKMEQSISFLKKRIETCKKFAFLSEEDANSYLFPIENGERKPKGEYLDFEQDFDKSFPELVEHIAHFFYKKKNLIYTEFQIINFLTLLLTNDLIILSGLSGSGKTQIVKAFAEVLGGVAKIIPVKPNWTSSEDLLGYYNPLQSSFLPTPFIEAIAEAKQNPHQLYLICLDEMNLARAEYYFADFLSKLEERSKQPKIDLYAKHEEEAVLAECKILFEILENQTKGTNINSWNNFLENDELKKQFLKKISFGNQNEDTLLQLHSKMRRKLINTLKFPSTIEIPANVRFIGAINIDETTHYFSPKILDRVHIMKFENPLLFENLVSRNLNDSNYNRELQPIYVHPKHFGERKEMPSLKENEALVNKLKTINRKYLLPLSIDFGVRSMRQAINYAKLFSKVSNFSNENKIELNDAISFNVIILQKVLPRFLFEKTEKKQIILGELKGFIFQKIELLQKFLYIDIYSMGFRSDKYLSDMLKNDDYINFWGVSVLSEIEELEKEEKDLPFPK